MLMKLDSDSTPAMTKVAVVSTTSRSLNRSPSISASARWVMRSSVAFARRRATSAVRKSLSSLKAAMCSALRPFTDLSVETARMTLRLDVGTVALRQAHGAKEHADRDLAGEIVDELEVFSLAYALERAVGNLESGRNELLDVPAREPGLAQRP